MPRQSFKSLQATRDEFEDRVDAGEVPGADDYYLAPDRKDPEPCADPKSSSTYFVTYNTLHSDDWATLATDDWIEIRGQVERCPETGRLHLPFRVTYRDAVDWNGIRKRYPGAHIEQPKSAAKVGNYVIKRDTREAGPFRETRGFKGHRTDWRLLRDDVWNGATRGELIRDHPHLYGQYHKGVELFRSVFREEAPRERPDVKFQEDPGTVVGKTGFVYWKRFEDWRGYEQQPSVFILEEDPDTNMLVAGHDIPLKIPYGVTWFRSKYLTVIKHW